MRERDREAFVLRVDVADEPESDDGEYGQRIRAA